jgi:hypothetical protein
VETPDEVQYTVSWRKLTDHCRKHTQTPGGNALGGGSDSLWRKNPYH